LVQLARAARARHRASILISNLAQDTRHSTNLFDASDPDGFVHLVAECNRQLARDLAEIPDAHVFDYAGTLSECGASRWHDPKLWYMARAACSSENMVPLARNLARHINALLRPAAKCLVIDLDNTLWGGVLGDDGPQGVKLGDDYPGNVFKDFQAALLGFRHRGFLLAISSKNDEQTVCEMLDSHPEMLLKREHFACIRANWEPKPHNLRAIAQQLNIGLDALVFIDDNPVERATVRAELPMVQVVELPADPLGYLAALRSVAGLDRPRLSGEDRGRAQMYRSESLRQQIQSQATSIEEFLGGLEMVAHVGRCDSAMLERVHQLIQKTNQFNLTTRRHNLDDVRRLIESPHSAVAWLRLRDRYGDLGLVCVGILRKLDTGAPDETWEIDTLLMSCRVMGRQVEDAFLAYLAELARDVGGKRLRGSFRPTAKNSPVAQFYPQHGFAELPGELPGQYEIDLNHSALAWPAVIRRGDAPHKENRSA
jgi:FkbH-like protein